MSKFELYHRKRLKDVTEIQMNDRMLWGQRMESIIAEGIGADNGVIVRKVPEYVRIVRSRMGATFDYEIIGVVSTEEQLSVISPDKPYALFDNEGKLNSFPMTALQKMFIEHGPGLFEIKATGYVEFRDNWTRNDDKTIEAPGHIEIQLQHQLHVKDSYKWGAIGVLVAGNSPKVTARMRDHEVGEGLEAACVQFWQDLKAGREPDPTFPGDAGMVKTLYSRINEGEIFDGREDAVLAALCNQYRSAVDVESAATGQKDSAKSRIYMHVGTAERALTKEFNVWLGTVGDSEVPAYTRKGYRSIKITRKKAS